MSCGTITTDELAAIREAAEAHLDSRATILRRSSVSDARGRVSAAPTVVATDVPARLGALRNGREIAITERRGAVEGYRISLPLSTDLVPADQVQMDGRTFEVLSTPRTPQASLLVAVCMEVS